MSLGLTYISAALHRWGNCIVLTCDDTVNALVARMRRLQQKYPI